MVLLFSSCEKDGGGKKGRKEFWVSSCRFFPLPRLLVLPNNFFR